MTGERKGPIMESPHDHAPGGRAERWIALALCAAVAAAWAAQQFVANRPTYGRIFAPDGIPLLAAGLGAAGIVLWNGRQQWPRARRALLWGGLLLMVWAANGLPLYLLRVVRLIPFPVDWPGLATKTMALAAVVVLARLVLARPAGAASRRPATWYGYAAFLLALPYPVLRVWWALGGTPGLSRAGAAGEGWAPTLLGIPWVMAAALSLLLIPTWRWLPRRLLLVAGWTATAIVGMVGPAASWAMARAWMGDAPPLPPGAKPSGIAPWVFVLFYGSWLLWAIAACAATRSYQLRSARAADVPADVTVRVGA